MSVETPRDSTSNKARDVFGTLFQGRDITVQYINGAISDVSDDSERTFGLLVPPSYVDRDEPRADAQRIIDEDPSASTMLTVFSKVQGGGTTAFGLKLLHEGFERDRARFPGGHVLVDLVREDPWMAVGRLLRLMDIPEEDIPATLEWRVQKLHQSPRWRSGIAVMVDSPGNFTDVRLFLATSPGSLTVVTGPQNFNLKTLGRDDRRFLRHVQWRSIQLDALSDEDAATMFRLRSDLAPSRPGEWAMVADFVAAAGGNPGLIADYAFDVHVERQCGAPDPLATAHRNHFGSDTVPGRRPRDRVDFAGLDDGQRALAVRLAGLPDVDFGFDLAEALMADSTGSEDVRAGLGILVERGVLDTTVTGSEPRFRFITRSMRSTFAPGMEKHLDTPQRALTHYYEIGYAAHRKLMPGRWLQVELDGRSAFPDSARTARSFASIDEARQALTPERQTLVKVVIDAVAAGHFAMAAELCEVLWPFWFHSGWFTDMVDAQAPVLRAALDTHHLEPARLSRLCVQTAIAYRRDRNPTDARLHAERALELARGEHPLVVLTAHDAIGDVEADAEEYDAAIGHFAEARRIAEGLDPVDLRALHIMERKEGVAHRRAGRSSEAEPLILHAKGLLAEDDHQNHARTETALGDLRRDQGRFEEALESYDGALDRHRLLGDLRRVGDVYVLRADVNRTRDAAASRADLERALEAYEAANAERDAVDIRERLAG